MRACFIFRNAPFWRQGVITENDHEEQRKAIKYNHLVSNLIIFHAVFFLTQVLENLVRQGYSIDRETISFVSPFITEHVDRFGNYSLNLKRRTPPLKIGKTWNAKIA
ncbi:Tn3 family transposase [Candidatus Manganitrophus noduliformans]|uniref:Tn3 family transposase n=1 Tax=Candidatus Manganitrophus noduliformans TaxID=2606439 RepID=A0A7X6IE14_9BACT|nr:Tn3 family transposase [Candidatus Manganitrophus noduliformans]